MKKLVSILLLALAAFSSYSQGRNPYWSNQVFRGGPILGLNFSQVDGDKDAGVHKLGLHAGLGSYVSITERLGIQLDILYSQKGSRYGRTWDSPAGPYQMVYKMKLAYIEMPISLNYYYTSDIHFGAGVSFNRLISSDESWRSLYGWRTLSTEQYPFSKNTWDGFLSCSYRLTDALRVELRYQRSITPIRSGYFTHQDFANGSDQQNNLFVLRLGYYL